MTGGRTAPRVEMLRRWLALVEREGGGVRALRSEEPAFAARIADMLRALRHEREEQDEQQVEAEVEEEDERARLLVHLLLALVQAGEADPAGEDSAARVVGAWAAAQLGAAAAAAQRALDADAAAEVGVALAAGVRPEAVADALSSSPKGARSQGLPFGRKRGRRTEEDVGEGSSHPGAVGLALDAVEAHAEGDALALEAAAAALAPHAGGWTAFARHAAAVGAAPFAPLPYGRLLRAWARAAPWPRRPAPPQMAPPPPWFLDLLAAGADARLRELSLHASLACFDEPAGRAAALHYAPLLDWFHFWARAAAAELRRAGERDAALPEALREPVLALAGFVRLDAPDLDGAVLRIADDVAAAWGVWQRRRPADLPPLRRVAFFVLVHLLVLDGFEQHVSRLLALLDAAPRALYTEFMLHCRDSCADLWVLVQ